MLIVEKEKFATHVQWQGSLHFHGPEVTWNDHLYGMCLWNACIIILGKQLSVKSL